MCDACFGNGLGDKGLGKFQNQVEDLLKVISGDEKAVADNTGFGDWSNEIGGKPFYADSGMVCVVEYSDKLKNYLDNENISLPFGGVAVLEVSDSADYMIDKSNPHWSVVLIVEDDRILRSL